MYVALQKPFLWFLKIATSNETLNERKASCLRFQKVHNLCWFSALIPFRIKSSVYFSTKPWKAQLSVNTGQHLKYFKQPGAEHEQQVEWQGHSQLGVKAQGAELGNKG